jgi:hypothetical protein
MSAFLQPNKISIHAPEPILQRDRSALSSQSVSPLTRWQSWICLLLVWLSVTLAGAIRIQEKGALASSETATFFRYCIGKYHSNPGSLRLQDSYAQWAAELPGTDAYNYICAGLGLFDGKGLAIKEVASQDLGSHNYVPYHCQVPGTPFAVWLVMRFFGNYSVCAYFCFISIIHLLTAALVCVLARQHFNRESLVLGAGLLSLCCLPVLDSNFGSGLFWSEPLAAPWLICGLIAIALFWRNLDSKSPSNRLVLTTAISAGVFFAVASYFRDIYTSFSHFAFATMLIAIVATKQRSCLKRGILFCTVGLLIFSMVQLPWEIRNLHKFKEFSMSGETYCNSALWWDTWINYKEAGKFGSAAAQGLGDYLAPDKSADIMSKLAANPREGSRQACMCFLRAFLRSPWQAIQFKLRVYDMLWLGLRSCSVIYFACLFSAIGFIVFLIAGGFTFGADLWLVPLFLISISPLIHYEHRYSQPFFLIVTPISTMYLIPLLSNWVRQVEVFKARQLNFSRKDCILENHRSR